MFKKIFALVLTLAFALPFYALAEGMDNAYRYAYSVRKSSDVDMTNVQVSASGLTGFALIGSERLDFQTSDFSVKNDGQGNLSGFAYGQNLGLVNFSGVKIDENGWFIGSADGGVIAGKIIFDCSGSTLCPVGTSYKVRTLWTKTSVAQMPVVTPVIAPVVAPAPVVPVITPTPVVSVPAVKPSLTMPANTTPKVAPVSYKDCDKINDYVSYVNCIADVDAKRASAPATPTPAVKTTPAKTTTATPAKQKVCKVAKEISTNLTVDVKSKDVENLQSYLVCAGFLTDTKYKKGTFDDITEKAVIAWQETNSLKCADGTACGYMGPSSRRLMNSGKAKLVESIKAEVVEPVIDQVVNDKPVAKPVKTETKKVVLKLIKGSMDIGAKGDDVKALQAILARDEAIYPEGKITGEFDSATEKAVASFQENKDLKCTDGTYCGYVGPSTKAKLNLWATEMNKAK